MCIVGPKNLATPTHFISSPRPTPRRKKCHATKGSLPERPKGKNKCNETAMGE